MDLQAKREIVERRAFLPTPLQGNLTVVKQIFEATNDAARRSMVWGTSMLQIACSRGHIRIVKWMLGKPNLREWLNVPSIRYSQKRF